jgi:hypothetical protein
VSAYFVCGFTGNALPVIGAGVIATFIELTVSIAEFSPSWLLYSA